MVFGDIFTLAEKQYVFLVEHLGYVHAALIRERGASQTLLRVRGAKFRDGYTESMVPLGAVQYQFVKLKTAAYEGQVASVDNSHGHDSRSDSTHEEGEMLEDQDKHDLCVLIEKSRSVIEPIKVIATRVKDELIQTENGGNLQSFDESQA